MNSIIRMITAAIAANGSSVMLLIEPTDKGFSAALVDEHSSETITMMTDWKMDLAVEGGSVESAIKALDELCAEDFN